MTKNMVEGNPLKLILNFAVPLLLGNLFQQTYNMADAAIVGQTLGPEALAAVGATSSVQFLVLGFCIGNMAGFAIPIAQRFGANDLDGMKRYEYQGCVWSAIIAIGLTALTYFFCPLILQLLRVPAEIYQNTYDYIIVIFLGLPFTILYNYLSSILRAIGDSKTPFIFLAISAVLNIFLDIFCIINLKWGVAGAAIATVFSQAVSGILCLALIKMKFPTLHIHKQQRKYDAYMSKRLLVMGLPMGLQYSITAIGSMIMQSSNNALGTVYVSAFTAGIKIKQFMLCPFDALATAVSTFVSQNYGAKKTDRIKEGLLQGTYVGVAYGVISGIALILFGRALSTLFITGNEMVLDASALYLRRMGYAWWLLGILNVVRMSVQGLGYAMRAIFCGVIEMICRTLTCVIFAPTLGYNAITWADQVAWFGAVAYVIPIAMITFREVSKQIQVERNAEMLLK